MNAITLTKARKPLAPAKEFAEFASWGDDLVDHHRRLSTALKEAESMRRSNPRGSVERLDSALQYVEAFPFEVALTEFDAALTNLFDDSIYDDDSQYRAVASMHLGALLGSFPSSNIPNVQVFTAALLDEVMAEAPNLICLQAACRKLRRTQKFMPTISEVLAEIERQADIWSARTAASCTVKQSLKKVRALRAEAAKEADEMDARLKAAKAAEEELSRRFPKEALVAHAKHGVGRVRDCRWRDVVVRFDRITMQLSPSDLRLLSPMQSPDLQHLNRRVFNPSAGFGTITALLGLDEEFVAVTFDDGQKRQVAAREPYLWLVTEEQEACA